MTSDGLIAQLVAMEQAHPESAKVTVGARNKQGHVTNLVVIRYLKKKHHVVIEGFSLEEAKRPARTRGRSAGKKHLLRTGRSGHRG